nr:tetratricopeptide repeat protein [Paraflavitalea speifideiaquila]
MLVDQPATAVKLLKACIEKYPDNTTFRRRLSEVFAQVGNSEDALDQYNQLLAKDSLDFETWYEKGNLLVQLQDTVAAIQAMERSYSLQPINYTGLALANLYASTKNPKTLVICDALIARDTTFINEATFLKGAYYSDTRQYAAALEQFEDCIKRNWKFTDAYIEKGIVQYDQKQAQKALKPSGWQPRYLIRVPMPITGWVVVMRLCANLKRRCKTINVRFRSTKDLMKRGRESEG